MIPPPNKTTGANAGGRRQLPIRTRWAARFAQFGRSASSDKRSICLIALGLLLLAVGVTVVSSLLTLAGAPSLLISVAQMIVTMVSSVLTFAGMFAIAVRYRKKPSLWENLAFLVLAFLVPAVVIVRVTDLPSSPLLHVMGAIPLMLYFVQVYLGEQRQKRAALAQAALIVGARHAEPSAPPNAGPATPSGSSGVAGGPPSVS